MLRENFILIVLLFSLCCGTINAQVAYTAKDVVQPYNGGFRPGSNLGYFPPWTDFQLANIAAGNEALNIDGVGVKSIRPGLFESFVAEWGYEFRVPAFEHYKALGLEDNTLIVGFPSEEHQDQTRYCDSQPSELFANLYEPIWIETADGKTVNPENYYAAYLYRLVELYGPYIRFWEIWNEPGLDYTGATGWLPPGAPGNWWDNNPEPCDYKLRAPIYHYIRILRISYDIIKSLDEDAYVCVSGTGYASFLDAILRNTDNPVDGSVTADYPHGGGAYFDVMGFHSYPHFDGATRRWSSQVGGFVYSRHSDAAAAGIARTKGIYQDVLSKYGFDGTTYPQKEWIITEINVPRRSFSEFLGSEEAQINFMMKAYFECIRQDIRQMHVYSLGEQKTLAEATYEFDLMGLYEKLNVVEPYQQVPTNAGIAYKTISDALFGKEFDPDRTALLQLPDAIDGGAFVDKDGFYTYLLWAKTQKDQSERISASYAFPSTIPSLPLSKKEWNFSETKATKLIESNNIPLMATPTLLQEIPFSYTPPACAPTVVTFEAADIRGGALWEWNVQGATPSYATGRATEFNFNQKGNFEVILTVYNAAGDVLLEQSDFLTIEGYPKPNFEIEVSGPLVYIQNNSSNNIESFEWDFGDQTTSRELVPNHTYAEAGQYNVTLTAKNKCGERFAEQQIKVQLPKPNTLGFTANDTVPSYDGYFRPGANIGYFPPWSDEQLATIAAGDLTNKIDGAGVKAIRPALFGSFVEEWGYDFRASTFDYYENLGLKENTLIVGFPSNGQRDPNQYCPTIQSEHFANLYDDIWDNGENGTPINDDNYFAVYLYNLVTKYKDHIRFWEIWNEPGLDFTGQRGWLPPGYDGNWWDSDPDPCDYKLRAPIQHFVRVMRVSYEVIKTLDKDAFVVLSGTGYLSFLDALLRNTDNPIDGSPTEHYPHSAGAYFDVMGFHSYPHFDGSTKFYSVQEGGFVYRRHSDAAADGLMRVRNNMQGILDQYGYDGVSYPSKEWIITECNIPRRNFNDFIGSDEAQRNFIIKAYVNAAINDFTQLHVFTLAEQTFLADASYEFHLMGLYNRVSGTRPYSEIKTPAGIAYKTASDLLFSTTYDTKRTTEMQLPAGVRGGAFKDASGKYIYVLWAETTVDNSEVATATYSFPSTWNYDKVGCKQWDFSETEELLTLSSKDIQLTAAPIFLTINEQIVNLPVAGFQANIQTGCTPLEVQFEDISVDAKSWQWTFEGASTPTSSERNPTVIYPEAGIFDVTLEVVNEAGTHQYTFENYIETTYSPTIDFDYEIDGNTVRFNVISDADPATKYTWDFGSGIRYNALNTSFHYPNSGDYQVTLYSNGICAQDTITKTITIAIPPTARLRVTEDSNCNRKVASFTNLSTITDEIEWFFPGGSPAYSTANNVIVLYRTAGTFEATLVAKNEYGNDTLTQTIISNVSPVVELTGIYCENETVVVNGTTYSRSKPRGRETINRGDKCDSIVNINFKFVDRLVTNLNTTLCAGEAIEVNGKTYDVDNPRGVEYFTARGGCDSLVVVDLEFLPVVETQLEATICDGQHFLFGEEMLTTTGRYQQVQASTNGCDSIIHLNLTALSPIQVENKVITPDRLGGNGAIQIELSGGQAPYQILWNTGATGSELVGVRGGRYIATVEDNAGCTAIFNFGIPFQPIIIVNRNYPNPVAATRPITLDITTSIAQQVRIELSNANGQIQLSQTVDLVEGFNTIPLTAPDTAGTYFIKLTYESGQVYTLLQVVGGYIFEREEIGEGQD